MIPAHHNPHDPVFTSDMAFDAYEAVRKFLPEAAFPATSRHIASLAEIADRFDAFVFDAYGVLNVGDTAIPGARECVEALQSAGKTCVVVTNAASFDKQASIRKFSKLGYRFPDANIITSRRAAEQALHSFGSSLIWGVLGLEEHETGELDIRTVFPEASLKSLNECDGFLFLSTSRWSPDRQALLEQSLLARKRPVVVANPDIIAPREDGLSTEPGYFGYRLAMHDFADVQFHGKPFPTVYDLAREGHPAIARGDRVLMIGDTLHTDVLGGASQGWSTALVTAHGLFRDVDVAPKIAKSGIVPDFIVPSI